MTTKILHPDMVTVTSGAVGVGVVVVGAGDVLSDDSDATYVEGDPSPYAINAQLPALTGYADGDTINLHLRLALESDDHTGTSSRLYVFLQDGHPDDDSGSFYVGQFTTASWNTAASFPPPFDGTIRDLVLPLVVAPGFTVGDCATVLASGTAQVAVNTLTILDSRTSQSGVRLYEAWVEVGTPDGCYTVDLPAYGAIAPYGGTREDTLATPDTSTEIVIADVFQDIAVGTYGAPYDPGANVVLPTIPAGMGVTDARYVVIAYRESGNDITADTSSWGYTPRGPVNEPFLYLDSSARSGRYLIDNLPIGGYGGELVSEFTESITSLQLDQPLNRLWLSYETSAAPPIHVAYLAIRLTICPAKSHPPPLRQFPRSDGYGAGPKRIYPRAPNRRAGKSY